MTNKFTPGPWKWGENPDKYSDMGCLLGPNNEVICHFGDSEQYYPTEGREPLGADARLIAVAPCLLAVLQDLVNNADFALPDDLTERLIKEARAAIRKARGEE